MNDRVRMVQGTLDQDAFLTTRCGKIVLRRSIRSALSRYNGGWSRKIEALCDICPRTFKDARCFSFP